MMKRHLILLLCQISLLLNLSAQNNSVLSNGNWYKITTNKNGIYKLDYSDFQALGVSVSSLQTSAIKLYGNGGGMLPKLNSDFEKLKLVILPLLILVFSPSYNSKIGELISLLKIPFFA